MFEHDDMNFDPTLHGDAQQDMTDLPRTPDARNTRDFEPTPVEQVFSQQPIRQERPQSRSGSYYSPRSGYPRSSGYHGGYPSGGYPGGGYVPPTGNGPQGPDGYDNGQPKKSHTGLKALAISAAAAIALFAGFAGYKLIQDKKDVTGTDRSTASVAEQIPETKTESSAPEAESSESNTETASTSGENLSFIELASRDNAMKIPDIVDKITPATVGIQSIFLYQGQTFSMFGFGQGHHVEQEVPATGTGIVMSDNGNGSYYIITNAHVIYDNSENYHLGEAKAVKVVLNPDYYSNNTEFDAEIVGYDVAEDIAVLKVTTNQQLTVAEFGNSDDLRVGELVVAIGNPLGFELFGSVTTGIVSALDREVTINDSKMKLIQTDTAINSGNSGGPLINSYGQVIGINSSKISSSYNGGASVEGLCFAIPISHAKDIINDLINYGYITGKPMMGINLTVDIDESLAQRLGIPVGVYIRDIEPGGAADLAGLREGDVIIAIGNKAVANYEEIKAESENYKAGDTMIITATRNGEDMEFSLILQEQKPSTV
ncbi:MAG: trypsin-like peptidase domain-containing protein [Oscillospiraceae bacterium]|nr:trypsin-like peptidase domain-containing protein [Oscillospiraceae bacterium]